MEQQQVRIIGFRANGYKAIEAVVLEPDLLQEKLVRIVGDIGNGKSSLMELMQIALSGSDAIAKKDALKTGFLSEVQIADGDHKLFMGARITEFSRGNKKGEQKFETFLYEKDIDGKQFAPIIDGRKATASDYMDMLHTEITFNMPLLFSNNQTEHRKLIESLFSNELAKLGIDEVLERITKAKQRQDNTRAICDAHGAFRSTFEDEGFTIEDLGTYTLIDIEKVRGDITAKEIEKDRVIRKSKDSELLEKERATNAKSEVLRGIQAKVQVVTEGIREKNIELTEKYNKEQDIYSDNVVLKDKFSEAKTELGNWPIPEDEMVKVLRIVSTCEKEQVDSSLVIPVMPITIDIKDGIPQITGTVAGYEDLIKKRTTLLAKYKAKQAEELVIPEREEPDTTKIEDAIEQLKARRGSAENNNTLVNRFSYWETWIEAKGLYEKEIDTLRKLYAKVDVGVKGMKIEPLTTKSNRIEIWIKYNGIYDGNFFGNEGNEFRFLFEYSAFQRSIIGLMLQAARLSLKPKALRMAFIDDISVTRRAVEMLHQICDELDLRLWTTYAKDDYDLDNIPDGEIIVEGGEIFFNQ